MDGQELIAFLHGDSILMLQKQVYKDFELLSNRFPDNFLEENYSLEEIRFFIKDNLTFVMEKNESKTLQLFYTIDIPEKQFLSLVSGENPIENLSEAILLREAQKVYFRMKYSK
jgi:hypothetical protein